MLCAKQPTKIHVELEDKSIVWNSTMIVPPLYGLFVTVLVWYLAIVNRSQIVFQSMSIRSGNEMQSSFQEVFNDC